MPSYSTPVILYILLQFLNLALLSILITMILRTKAYFTKWTLFQLCFSTFFEQLSGLPSILIYGDTLRERAYETPICIIQQKVALFFFPSFQMFPAVLAFYLWWALYKRDTEIEKKSFRYIFGGIWGYTVISCCIRWSIESSKEHWATEVNRLFCRPASNMKQNWLIFLIPMAILSLIAAFLASHSTIMLFQHWRQYVHRQNRNTAIKLGQAVRLSISSNVYICCLLFSLLPPLIKRTKKVPDPNELVISDYAGSIQGIVLFLIFGTTKSAAVFLPCCYYAPPDRRRDLESPSLKPNDAISNKEIVDSMTTLDVKTPEPIWYSTQMDNNSDEKEPSVDEFSASSSSFLFRVSTFDPI
ncbi:hypothetical protein G9A89_001867 [Geosiphon pyriformis]|nr:hypothetical protein G9A89_001867 [Geosiphon pyriformis]